MTLDDVSFTTKIPFAPYRCVALFDTGSPKPSFGVTLDRMLLGGAASAACERPCTPRSWRGFGESTPLWTSTSIRLSVKFFRDKESTCSLGMWACEVPPSVMQRAVILGRDCWMRFNTRSYRTLPSRPHDNRVLGELTSHHATTGVSADAIDPAATDGGFHLLYDGTIGIILSDEPQLLEVN